MEKNGRQPAKYDRLSRALPTHVSSSASLLADKIKDNPQLQALMNALSMAFGMPDAPRRSQFATQLRKFLTMVVTSSSLKAPGGGEEQEAGASSEEVEELKTAVEELSEKLEAVTAEATNDRVQMQEATQELANQMRQNSAEIA